MTNKEIAKLLKKIAAAYILKNENKFRIIAYERAAEAIENSTAEAKDLWKEGKLTSIAGVGSTIASHLDEIFRTGHSKHFESVFKELPAALFPLLDIPGFGAKKAYKLASQLSLRNAETAVDDLLEAANDGKIVPIAGFGEKSQTDIIEAIERFKKGQVKENRMPLPYANAIALEVLEYLKKHKDTTEAVPLGSLRRKVSTIGDIDIAVATDNPAGVVDWFLSYPKMSQMVEKGPGGATILLTNGHQIDLRVCSQKRFGAMLQYFTGSKNHNIKLRELALKRGLSLNEYGMKPLRKVPSSKFQVQNYDKKTNLYQFSVEEELYKSLGLPLIPPELREGRGEIEAGLRNNLPKLITSADIKGDLHIHTNYDIESSHDMGTSSVEDILKQAAKLNYEYIGVSDHNPSHTKHDSNQIVSMLKTRKSKFEHIIYSTKSVRVNLFIMLEVDILPDGKLPLPDEAFEYLDGIIVSIHSSFHMQKAEMTDRIIRGLSHPKARILAHPTGRLIGSREGYEVDWTKLFRFCSENNKAIEINSYPTRLDLPDVLVPEAIKEKVKLVIDTDSHEVSQMELIQYGVSVARRGWATRDDILNTLPYNKVKGWLLES